MNSHAHKQDFLSPVYLLGVMLRFKWTLIVPTLTGFGLAAYLYVSEPPTFVSEARLLVRYVTEASLVEEEAAGGRIRSPDTRGQGIINAELEILTSQSLMEAVVDELGPALVLGEDPESAHRGNAVLQLFQGLYVDVPRRGNVIRLQFSHSSPEVAQRVLDRMVHRYLEKHAVIHKMAGEYEFLTQQTDMLRSRLTQTEDELRRLKQDIGVTTLAETKSVLMTRLETLNASLREARAALAAARARHDFAKAHFNDTENGTTSGRESMSPAQRQQIATLQARLKILREREATLLNSFSEDSTLVREVRLQIGHVQTALEREAPGLDLARLSFPEEGGRDPSVAMIGDLVALAARVKVLEGYVEEAQKSIDELNRREAQLVRLQRQWEMLDINYRSYARSLEHAQIQDALNSGQQANIGIVQPATYPLAAAYPTRKKRAAFALGGGWAIGVLLALFRESARAARVADPADAERMVDAPVLITVPLAAPSRKRIGRRQEFGAPLALPAHEGNGSGRKTEAPLLFSHELRPYFDTLCDRLLMKVEETAGQPVMIGIAGCQQGAGVSTITAGLGAALSRLGVGRILLVDASDGGAEGLRGPTAGVIDLLRDEEGQVAVIQPNLYILTAHEAFAEEGHMALFRRLQDLLKTLEASQYRYVLLQLPPISETSSALVVGRQLHGVLLVLEAGRIRKEKAERAAELLRHSGATVLGTILNKHRRVSWAAA